MSVFSDVSKQALADRFQRDRISIYPSPASKRGTVNADFTTTYTNESPKWHNIAAHIEPLAGAGRGFFAGRGDIVSEEIFVKVDPLVAEDTQTGDLVIVESSLDPGLADAQLIVERVEFRTAGLQRRIVCRRAHQYTSPGGVAS